MFKLRVDTGGTFTDCWGSAAGENEPRLVKVLSSGRLRVSITEWISPQEVIIDVPANWKVQDAFFTGYKLESIGESALVLSFEMATSRIVLSRPVPQSSAIDLFTREEAPVLGARLLTGTSLDDSFPPLEFRLATTRGTNALLERKGAPVAFFTTRGFADLLVIRDQRRSDLFALQHERPLPLFEAVHEIEERLDADGNVLVPLHLDEKFDLSAKQLLENGITVAAVALLHSYQNPAHELAVRERLLELGFDHVSVSSELAPLIKILPRAETSVANTYLHPVMQSFLDHVQTRIGGDGQMLTMTSAGGLEPIDVYRPKDSLLSGPAGGVAGAAALAEDLGFERILTFDMGGTSTDVARYDRGFLYRFEQVVGDARLLSPALKIETVASGGGSICHWKNGGLHVGPESAGADPGPACYGRGGPLTITDVNLLLGRIDPDNFGIPLGSENLAAAQSAAMALQGQAGIPANELNREFLQGLLAIAIEQMADAIRTISIRDGADPTEYALLAFGGAGPLHACEIAERLGMETVLIPAEAGLLSAYGLDRAEVERFIERQINLPASSSTLPSLFRETDQQAISALEQSRFTGAISKRMVEARLAGQDATLSLSIETSDDIPSAFAALYHSVFGYEPSPDREVEVVSYRAVAATARKQNTVQVDSSETPSEPDPTGLNGESNPVARPTFLDRARLNHKETIDGPVIIQDPFSTFFLKEDWTTSVAENGALIAKRHERGSSARTERPEQIERELFRHRFDNLVEEMGTMLQRSAISTNVKERADFSCALLDGEGELITSAPHIPVHLGALGLCVRMVREKIKLKPGDTVVTNHPAVGGSHLPDVTLITPVFAANDSNPIAYIANRAHHAEIGGITPGSMPAGANNLAEEGVVLSPTLLIEGGNSRFDQVSDTLTSGPYPTRNLSDNLADLNAQLASNLRGKAILADLLESHGAETVAEQMAFLKSRSLSALDSHLESSSFQSGEATEHLDDGTKIQVSITNQDSRLKIDFSGTAETHPTNLHATPAIVQSAVLYVLRLWSQSEVPLNEGMLASVEIELPTCFLNPAFDPDPVHCPAVVGGNVETSQRVVDTLIKALGFQACSQGTMNNFLFGDDSFGYYETICGGSGAGVGYHGTPGLHTHMTNTAITDPEILEQRYPVRLHRFAIRPDSGGKGQWTGGDGVIREVEFLKPLEVSLLTQHRKVAPYGIAGGEEGSCGSQSLNGELIEGVAHLKVDAGDRLIIETPGGGGCGAWRHRTFNAQCPTLNV